MVRNGHRFALCGAGTSLSPLVHLLPHLFPRLLFSLSLALLFSSFVHPFPSLSTRIVPLHFQAGGRWRRPNLGLVYFVCVICIP